jgi:hypothetical protein
MIATTRLVMDEGRLLAMKRRWFTEYIPSVKVG